MDHDNSLPLFCTMDDTAPQQMPGIDPPADQSVQESAAAADTFEATMHLAALHMMCDTAAQHDVIAAINRLDDLHRCLSRRTQGHRQGHGVSGKVPEHSDQTLAMLAVRSLHATNDAIAAVRLRLDAPNNSPTAEALAHLDGATDRVAQATRSLFARSGVAGITFDTADELASVHPEAV